jgi:hypothetical protein
MTVETFTAGISLSQTDSQCFSHLHPASWQADNRDVCKMSNIVIETSAVSWLQGCLQKGPILWQWPQMWVDSWQQGWQKVKYNDRGLKCADNRDVCKKVSYRDRGLSSELTDWQQGCLQKVSYRDRGLSSELTGWQQGCLQNVLYMYSDSDLRSKLTGWQQGCLERSHTGTEPSAVSWQADSRDFCKVSYTCTVTVTSAVSWQADSRDVCKRSWGVTLTSAVL